MFAGCASRAVCIVGAATMALAAQAAPAGAHFLTERVSLGPGGAQDNGASFGDPAISADGRFVAFDSVATNLVPGDTNGTYDVFVRDRRTRHDRARERRAGRRPGQRASASAPAISADGRFVAFHSRRHQPRAGRHERRRSTSSSATARAGTTERVSVGAGRRPGQRRQLRLRRSRPTAASSRSSSTPPTSCRATRTARSTSSSATARAGTTERVSVGPGGAQGNGDSGAPAISADGRFVAFDSLATNLVPGDTNGAHDVFVRDRQSGHDRARERRTRAAPRATAGSFGPAISADGRFVAFVSHRHEPRAGRHERHGATSSSATARRARPSA